MEIAYGNGRLLAFKVLWQRVYPNQKIPVRFMFGATRERGLVLMTCTGAFHRGTGYDHKRLVYARLISP